MLTDKQKANILEEQLKQWPCDLDAGAKGNPYATLCQNCYGRHTPPRDQICPHESIGDLKKRTRGK